MSAKEVILTAIHFKGVEQVKKELKTIAENSLCSEAYVKSIIKKVETSKILVNEK
jgi:hypothetical protein